MQTTEKHWHGWKVSHTFCYVEIVRRSTSHLLVSTQDTSKHGIRRMVNLNCLAIENEERKQVIESLVKGLCHVLAQSTDVSVIESCPDRLASKKEAVVCLLSK